MNNKIQFTFMLSAFLLLTACGGGSDSNNDNNVSPTTPDIISEGLWVGSTFTNRNIVGLVLDDGSYYFLYSAVGNSSLISGVIQGASSMNGDSFTSSNAKDFNLEGLGVLSSTISGTVATKQSFDGTVTYSDNSTSSFTTSYDSNYELSPSLLDLAGTFSGSAASSAGVENADIVIAEDGSITGMGASGCQLTGQLNTRDNGNVYNSSITFGGSPCLFANETLTGIAYYDIQDSVLYVVAPNTERTDGVIFTGSR